MNTHAIFLELQMLYYSMYMGLILAPLLATSLNQRPGARAMFGLMFTLCTPFRKCSLFAHRKIVDIRLSTVLLALYTPAMENILCTRIPAMSPDCTMFAVYVNVRTMSAHAVELFTMLMFAHRFPVRQASVLFTYVNTVLPTSTLFADVVFVTVPQMSTVI